MCHDNTGERHAAALDDKPVAMVGPKGWKRRLEDPLNTYYRYPVARAICRVLIPTSVTPNQVTFVQPVFAAIAGYLITFNDWRYLVAAAVAFELRSILDCVDGTLARAKNMMSPSGHAIDALADWLGVVFLYIGVFVHFQQHPPPVGVWSEYISAQGILAIAVFQGAVRSFASDYYKTKYCSMFEQGRDETRAALRNKLAALTPESSFFARADIFIARMGHLSFEHEWFDPRRDGEADEAVLGRMARETDGPKARLVGRIWSISNGDAFLSLIVLSALLNQLWLGQIFFATAGVVWIFGFIIYNGHFLKSFQRPDAVAVRA